jgi:hypothetical protein
LLERISVVEYIFFLVLCDIVGDSNINVRLIIFGIVINIGIENISTEIVFEDVIN